MHVVCLSVYGGKSHTPHIYIHIYAMHTPLPVAFTRVFVLVVIVLEYELLWQHENQNKTVWPHHRAAHQHEQQHIALSNGINWVTWRDVLWICLLWYWRRRTVDLEGNFFWLIVAKWNAWLVVMRHIPHASGQFFYRRQFRRMLKLPYIILVASCFVLKKIILFDVAFADAEYPNVILPAMRPFTMNPGWTGPFPARKIAWKNVCATIQTSQLRHGWQLAAVWTTNDAPPSYSIAMMWFDAMILYSKQMNGDLFKR